MRTAILHIGTEKTGTTTIQSMLELNRDRLPSWGFAYPESCGIRKSQNLVLYSMDDERCEDVHLVAGLDTPEKRIGFKSDFRRALAAEMAGLPKSVHTIILSAEHFHSRLVDERELVRLRELLASHFHEVRIIVYLRRQDQLATSLYSTAMRGGETRQDVLPVADAASNYYNYELLLGRWAKVFSEDNLVPRLFEKRSFLAGSLLQDFAAACGLDDACELELPADRNEGLTVVAQEFLRHLNMREPVFAGGKVNEHRVLLNGFIDQEFAGAGRLPSREAAVRFQSLFHGSNERVRQRWFPERSLLFDDDFSMYPPEDEEPRFGFGDAVGVSAAIWRRSSDRIRALEAEIAFRRGWIARMKKDWRQAEADLRAALELDPGHEGARRMLDKVAKRAAAVQRRPLLFRREGGQR